MIYQADLKKKLSKIMPEKISGYIAKYVSVIKYNGFSQANQELFGWLKRK